MNVDLELVLSILLHVTLVVGWAFLLIVGACVLVGEATTLLLRATDRSDE